MSRQTGPPHRIIKLSFQKLIETNSEFKDLLFLICFLNSQNIPKSLLEFYKDPVIVENFLHELKKYSLVTSVVSEKDKEVTFSIHRSTQTLGRACLLDQLKATEQKELLDKTIVMIQAFYKSNVDKKYSAIREVIPHLQTFLRDLHTINLPKEHKDIYIQDISYMLGYAHKRGFRNLLLEKQYLSKTYELQKNTHSLSNLKLATLLHDLASTCTDLEYDDEAILYAEESIKMLRTEPHSELLVAENFRILGYAYTFKNNFEQARSYLNKALEKISHLDSNVRKETESDIYAQLAWLYAVTYLTRDKAMEAKKFALKSLEIINQEHLLYNQASLPQKTLSRYVARHRTNLGEVYCRLGDYKEAVILGFREVQHIIDHQLDHCPHYLLKVYLAIGLGEVYLREGQLEEAKKKLTQAISDAERIASKSLSLCPRIFYVETLIRMGDLKAAYNECLSALAIDKKINTNYTNLMYSLRHYHAGVIQYKLENSEKSLEHFENFLKEIKLFSEKFFDKAIYENLNSQMLFELPNRKNPTKSNLQDCIHKSTTLLIAIYGHDHPFIKNYVLATKFK